MLQSYLNDSTLKAATIEAMKEDIQAERLVKGHYWKGKSKTDKKGNGCFVGCVIRGDDHSKFEKVLGVPEILAHLADSVFENLPFEDSKKFSIDFLEAIPVGADLSRVWDRCAHWLLVDKEYGVIQFAKEERDRAATQAVADLYARKIKGEPVEKEEWVKAYKEASASAYAYASASASASAYAYAYASASASASAYAYAYASASARERHCVAFATYFLSCLREAPTKLAA